MNDQPTTEVEDIAKLKLSALAMMRESLSVEQSVRDEASLIAQRYDIEEPVLWSEWLNDTIGDRDAYTQVMADKPAVAYIEWVKERVLDRYRVSAHALNRVESRHGMNIAMRLRMTTWEQEIAWAHRNRSSRDSSVVVLSQLFLQNTIKQPSKAFMALADIYALALDDVEYVTASEHDLIPAQIRAGKGEDHFGPLYLRYARSLYSERLSGLSSIEIEGMASRFRKVEAAETSAISRSRAIFLFRESRIVRMTGVITVAREVGLGSDALLIAEEKFVSLINTGEINLPSDVTIPYSIFINWLRATPHTYLDEEIAAADARKTKKAQRVEKIALIAAVDAMIDRYKGWQSELPEEYNALGGGRWELFRDWVEPITKRERPAPTDLVLDFGFYLVQRATSTVE